MAEQQTHPPPVASQSRSLYEDDTGDIESPEPSVKDSQSQALDISTFPEHQQDSEDESREKSGNDEAIQFAPIDQESQQLRVNKASESQYDDLDYKGSQQYRPQSPSSSASQSGQEDDDQEQTEQVQPAQQTEEIMSDADEEQLLQQGDPRPETPTKQGLKTSLAQQLAQRADNQPLDNRPRNYPRQSEPPQGQANTQPTSRPQRQATQNFQDFGHNRGRQLNEARSASPILDQNKNPPHALAAFNGSNMPTPPKPGAEREPSQRGTSNAHAIVVEDEGSEDDGERSVEGTQECQNENDNHIPKIESEEELAPFNWKDLYNRFDSAMEAKEKEEQELQERYNKLVQFYNVWSTTGSFHEEDRAAKRLRTRMEYVQHTEDRLEQKRLHHENVLRAFHQAMEILGNAPVQTVDMPMR
ncbi:MAG: hypothetical protein M1831_007575 [Alyxoria varia]|nr:MAG: hypothetical protein M1831_007575 [Alyxoria varia]